MQSRTLLFTTIVVALITSVDGQSTCEGRSRFFCSFPCQWYNGACATGCSFLTTNETTCTAATHCTWLNSACGYNCTLISSRDPCDSALGCQWTDGSCRIACSRYSAASCDTSYCIGLSGACLSNCTAVSTTACGVNTYSSCVVDGATCNFRCSSFFSSACPTARGQCQIIGDSCFNICNTSSSPSSCSLYATSCTWGPSGCHVSCNRLSATTCTQAPFGTACEFVSGVAVGCIEACNLITTSTTCTATINCRWNGRNCIKRCASITTSPSTACSSESSGTCAFQLDSCRAVCSMATDATTCAQSFFSTDCQWNGTTCITACSASRDTCPSYCVPTGRSSCTPNCPMTSVALCGSNSYSGCSSAVFSDTLPQVACSYRCNSFTTTACPTSNGYCQVAGASCLDNCSRIVSGTDCGKFTSCRWYTTQGCQVNCVGLPQTTCANFSHCTFVAGSCAMKCDMFTNPTDCAYWYECTWFGTSCRRSCSQFGSSTDCTTVAGSYCTREPSSSTLCIPICTALSSVDVCVNPAFASYCAWRNGTCSRRCNEFNTTYCATQPQCQVVGSSCMANCAYAAPNDFTSGLPVPARCGQYPEYGSCVWAGNICVDSCASYFSSTSCLQVSTCQYARNTCLNKCDQFGQIACSTLSSSCIWANSKCQTRCQVLNSTMCRSTDYCNWDTTSNQCVTACGALDRPACDTEWSGRCGWIFGTCRTRCSVYTTTDCPSDYCVVAGTRCRTKCSLAQNTTACSLNFIMTTDCNWFPQFNLCLTVCSAFNSLSCPSSYCSPATGGFTTGCVSNCAIAYDPTSPTDVAQRCGSATYTSCKWFDGQCIAQCNNGFGCSTTSCVTVKGLCMNPCSSAPSRQWCTGGYSSCTWIASSSSCKPKCIGLVARSCPSDYCSNSTGFCLPQCNLLLSQEDCGSEDASCLWVNDQCISHCQTYTAAGCTPSHCEVINGACKVRCSFASTASACSWRGWNSNCYWLNNTCTIRCNNFGTNGVCPQPYCMWSGSNCVQDCAYGTRYNWNTNMGFQCSGNCQMYSNLTTCTTRCNSFSPTSCPLKRCNISSISGNCINPCNMAVTALECGLMGADNGGTCQWVPSQNLCRERCTGISKTLCPLDYCSTTSSSCVTRCDMFSDSRTSCLSGEGCAYTNGVCHLSCYSQPSTNCDPNNCLVNGTNCLPRCEFQTDPTSCEQNTMSYCAWRSGQCRLRCNYQQVRSCDTSYCLVTGTSCRPRCTGGQDPNGNAPLYDRCLWGTYGACQWNAGECVARCSDFGSACPAYPTCLPFTNIGDGSIRCLDPCNTTTNATRCTDVFTSCTWANGQCLPACSQFSTQRSCAVASYCYWRNQASTVQAGCYPVCSQLTTANGCSGASTNNYYTGTPSCVWSGTQCLTDCQSFDTGSCPSSYCDVSGQNCIFRCSLFSSATDCDNQSGNTGAGTSCAWVGDSCKTLCSLYSNTSCPSHCATSYTGNCLFQCSLASLTSNGNNGGSRTYCGGSDLFGHCFVSLQAPGGTSTCTSRCYQNDYSPFSTGCLSTPSANCELIAGQCFDKCSSITNGDICAQLTDCNWVAGACSRKCTTLPATACSANPLCETDPLGNCAPKCSALTNALDCNNVGTYSQYCRWGSNGVCTKGCSQYTYGTCPTGSTSQCRRTTAGNQCLYKCSFWTDSSNCSQSMGCTWSSSTGVCVDNCIYNDAPNCPSNCNQLSGTCSPGTCAAYGSSSCYADQLPCANISGTCATRCTGSAYTECSLSTCVLNPDSWVGPQCVDQCPSSLSQFDCGNRLGCMYDSGSCKINCLFASLSTCATLSHCQVVSPRCYPQCSALSSAASCGQYPSSCTWSGSSCGPFVAAAPTTRTPLTPNPSTNVPPTPLPPGQTFAPTTATPPTQSTQLQSTSTQAQPTPASTTFVTLTLTLGGNYVPLMTTSNRPALENALRTDLARSFGVPFWRVAILSLTLGSLNVAFIVSDVSVASAQATMSILTSQPTTTTFPDLSTMYAANNAGASTTVNSVAITAASAPYGPGASSDSSTNAVGIGIGVTVAVLVVIGIIVAAILISRKSNSPAAPARQEQQQPFLSSVPATLPPARVNPVTAARDQEMYLLTDAEL